MDAQLKDLLDAEAARFNVPEFAENDPVKFPRMFTDKRDIEIASLLTSTIAWGNRPMILRSAEKMFGLMDWQPYAYIMEKGYDDLPDGNVHRTFFNKNLRNYLRGLYEIYSRHATLEDFAAATGAASTPFPAWKIAEAINHNIAAANGGVPDPRCLPVGLDKSALKRFNMALRWLVRDDGIVDLGVWKVLKPSQLFIPLDVHVGNTSRELGLLRRSSNDRRAVEQLTGALRLMDPDDPVKYDFALFGIGVSAGPHAPGSHS